MKMLKSLVKFVTFFVSSIKDQLCISTLTLLRQENGYKEALG